jgi:hypothetical protein
MRVGQEIEDLHGRRFELVAAVTWSSDDRSPLPDDTIERMLSGSEAAKVGDSVNIPLVPGDSRAQVGWKLGNLKFTRVS